MSGREGSLESAGVQLPEPHDDSVADMGHAPAPAATMVVPPSERSVKAATAAQQARYPSQLQVADSKRKMSSGAKAFSAVTGFVFLLLILCYTAVMLWGNTLMLESYFGLNYVNDEGDLALEGDLSVESLGIQGNGIFGNLQIIGSESRIVSSGAGDLYLDASNSIILDSDVKLMESFRVGDFDLTTTGGAEFQFDSNLHLNSQTDIILEGQSITLTSGYQGKVNIEAAGELGSVEIPSDIHLYSTSWDDTTETTSIVSTIDIVNASVMSLQGDLSISSMADLVVAADEIDVNNLVFTNGMDGRRASDNAFVIEAEGHDGLSITPGGSGRVVIEDSLIFSSDGTAASISSDDSALTMSSGDFLQFTGAGVQISASGDINLDAADGAVINANTMSLTDFEFSTNALTFSRDGSLTSDIGLEIESLSGSVQFTGDVASQSTSLGVGSLQLRSSDSRVRQSGSSGLSVSAGGAATFSATNEVSLSAGDKLSLTGESAVIAAGAAGSESASIAVASNGDISVTGQAVSFGVEESFELEAGRGSVDLAADGSVVISSASSMVVSGMNGVSVSANTLTLTSNAGSLSLDGDSVVTVYAGSAIINAADASLTTTYGADIVLSATGGGVSVASSSGGVTVSAGYTKSEVVAAADGEVSIRAKDDATIKGEGSVSLSGGASSIVIDDGVSMDGQGSVIVNAETVEIVADTATITTSGNTEVISTTEDVSLNTPATLEISASDVAQVGSALSGDDVSFTTVRADMNLKANSGILSVNADEAISLTADLDVDIEADDGVQLSAQSVEVSAESEISFAASGNVEATGASVRFESGEEIAVTASTGQVSLTSAEVSFSAERDIDASADGSISITSDSGDASLLLDGSSATISAASELSLIMTEEAEFDAGASLTVDADSLSVEAAEDVEVSATSADVTVTEDASFAAGGGVSVDSNGDASVEATTGDMAFRAPGGATSVTAGAEVSVSAGGAIRTSSRDDTSFSAKNSLDVSASGDVSATATSVSAGADQIAGIESGSDTTLTASLDVSVHSGRGDVNVDARSGVFSVDAGESLSVSAADGVSINAATSASLSAATGISLAVGDGSIVAGSTFTSTSDSLTLSASDVSISGADDVTLSQLGSNAGQVFSMSAEDSIEVTSESGDVSIAAIDGINVVSASAEIRSGELAEIQTTNFTVSAMDEIELSADEYLTIQADDVDMHAVGNVKVSSVAGGVDIVAGVEYAAGEVEVYLGAADNVEFHAGSGISVVAAGEDVEVEADSVTLTSMDDDVRIDARNDVDVDAATSVHVTAGQQAVVRAGVEMPADVQAGHAQLLASKTVDVAATNTVSVTAADVLSLSAANDVSASGANVDVSAGSSLTASAGDDAELSAGNDFAMNAATITISSEGSFEGSSVDGTSIGADSGDVTISTEGSIISDAGSTSLSSPAVVVRDDTASSALQMTAVSGDALFTAADAELNVDAAGSVTVNADTAQFYNEDSSISISSEGSGSVDVVSEGAFAASAGEGILLAAGTVDSASSRVGPGDVMLDASDETTVNAESDVSLDATDISISAKTGLNIDADSVEIDAREHTTSGQEVNIRSQVGATYQGAAGSMEVSHEAGVVVSSSAEIDVTSEGGPLSLNAGVKNLDMSGSVVSIEAGDAHFTAQDDVNVSAAEHLTVLANDVEVATADSVTMTVRNAPNAPSGHVLLDATTVRVHADDAVTVVSHGEAGVVIDAATDASFTAATGSVSVGAGSSAMVSAATDVVVESATGVLLQSGYGNAVAPDGMDMQVRASEEIVVAASTDATFVSNGDASVRAVAGQINVSAGQTVRHEAEGSRLVVGAEDDVSMSAAQAVLIQADASSSAAAAGEVGIAASADVTLSAGEGLVIEAASNDVTFDSDTLVVDAGDVSIAAGANAFVTADVDVAIDAADGSVSFSAPTVAISAQGTSVRVESDEFTSRLEDSNTPGYLSVNEFGITQSTAQQGVIDIAAPAMIEVNATAWGADVFMTSEDTLSVAADDLQVSAFNDVSISALRSSGAINVDVANNFDATALDGDVSIASLNNGKSGGAFLADAETAELRSRSGEVIVTGHDGVDLEFTQSTSVGGHRVELAAFVGTKTARNAVDGGVDLYAEQNLSLDAANGIDIDAAVDVLVDGSVVSVNTADTMSVAAGAQFDVEAADDVTVTAGDSITIAAGTVLPAAGAGDIAVAAAVNVVGAAINSMTMDSTAGSMTVQAVTGDITTSAVNGNSMIGAESGSVLIASDAVTVATSENVIAAAEDDVAVIAEASGLSIKAGTSCADGAVGAGQVDVRACDSADVSSESLVSVTAETGLVLDATAGSASVIAGSAVDTVSTTLNVVSQAQSVEVEGATSVLLNSESADLTVGADQDIFARGASVMIAAGVDPEDAGEGNIAVAANADVIATASTTMTVTAAEGSVSVTGTSVDVDVSDSLSIGGGEDNVNMGTGGVAFEAGNALLVRSDSDGDLVGDVIITAGEAGTSSLTLTDDSISIATTGFIEAEALDVLVNADTIRVDAAQSFAGDLTVAAENLLSINAATDLLLTTGESIALGAGDSVSEAVVGNFKLTSDNGVVVNAGTTFSTTAVDSALTSEEGDISVASSIGGVFVHAGTTANAPVTNRVRLETENTAEIQTVDLNADAVDVVVNAGALTIDAADLVDVVGTSSARVAASNHALLGATATKLGMNIGAGTLRDEVFLSTLSASAVGTLTLNSGDVTEVRSLTADVEGSAPEVVLDATSTVEVTGQNSVISATDVEDAVLSVTAGAFETTATTANLRASDWVTFNSTDFALTADDVNVDSAQVYLTSTEADVVVSAAGAFDILANNQIAFNAPTGFYNQHSDTIVVQTDAEARFCPATAIYADCSCDSDDCSGEITMQADGTLDISATSAVLTSLSDDVSFGAVTGTDVAIDGAVAINAATDATIVGASVSIESEDTVAAFVSGANVVINSQTGVAFGAGVASDPAAAGEFSVRASQHVNLDATSSDSDAISIFADTLDLISAASMDMSVLGTGSVNMTVNDDGSGVLSVAGETGLSIAADAAEFVASAGGLSVESYAVLLSAEDVPTDPATLNAGDVSVLAQDEIILSATSGSLSLYTEGSSDITVAGDFTADVGVDVVVMTYAATVEATTGSTTLRSLHTDGITLSASENAAVKFEIDGTDRLDVYNSGSSKHVIIEAPQAGDSLSIEATDESVTLQSTGGDVTAEASTVTLLSDAGSIDISTTLDGASRSLVLSKTVDDELQWSTPDDLQLSSRVVRLLGQGEHVNVETTNGHNIIGTAETKVLVQSDEESIDFATEDALSISSTSDVSFTAAETDIILQTEDGDTSYISIIGGLVLQNQDSDGTLYYDTPGRLSECQTGEIRWDSDGMYVCVNGDSVTEKWKYAALEELSGDYYEAYVVSLEYHLEDDAAWTDTTDDEFIAMLSAELGLPEENISIIDKQVGSVIVTVEFIPDANVPNANTAQAIQSQIRALFADAVNNPTTAAIVNFSPSIVVTLLQGPSQVAPDEEHTNDDLSVSFNSLPLISLDDDIVQVSVLQDSTTSVISVSVEDFEDDRSNLPLTVFVFSEGESIVANTVDNFPGTTLDDETLQLNIDGTSGTRTFQITPNAGVTGTTTIIVTVMDSVKSTSTVEFTLTVYDLEDNGAPVVETPTTDIVVDEDADISGITLTLTDDKDNGKDLYFWAEYEMLEVGEYTDATMAYGNPPLRDLELEFTYSGDGDVRYLDVELGDDKYGVAVVTVKVMDSVGAIGTNTFQLAVRAVDDDPTISALDDRKVYEDFTMGAMRFEVGDVEDPVEDLQLIPYSEDDVVVPERNMRVLGDDVLVLATCSTTFADVLSAVASIIGYEMPYACPAGCSSGYEITNANVVGSDITFEIGAHDLQVGEPVTFSGDGVIRDAADTDFTSYIIDDSYVIDAVDGTSVTIDVSADSNWDDVVDGDLVNSFATETFSLYPAAVVLGSIPVDGSPVRYAYSGDSRICDGAISHASLHKELHRAMYVVDADNVDTVTPEAGTYDDDFGVGVSPGDVVYLNEDYATAYNVLEVTTGASGSIVLDSAPSLDDVAFEWHSLTDRTFTATKTSTVGDGYFIVDGRQTTTVFMVNGTIPAETDYLATTNDIFAEVVFEESDFSSLEEGSTIRVYHAGSDTLTADAATPNLFTYDGSDFATEVFIQTLDYILVDGNEYEVLAVDSVSDEIYVTTHFKEDAGASYSWYYSLYDREIEEIDDDENVVTADTPWPGYMSVDAFTVTTEPRFTLIGDTASTQPPVLECSASDDDAAIDIPVLEFDCDDWRITTADTSIADQVVFAIRCPVGCLEDNHIEGQYGVSTMTYEGEGTVSLKANSNNLKLVFAGTPVCSSTAMGNSYMVLNAPGHGLEAGDPVSLIGHLDGAYTVYNVTEDDFIIPFSNPTGSEHPDSDCDLGVVLLTDYAVGDFIKTEEGSLRTISSVNKAAGELTVSSALNSLGTGVAYSYTILKPDELYVDNYFTDLSKFEVGDFVHVDGQTTRVVTAVDEDAYVVTVDDPYDEELSVAEFRISKVPVYGGVDGQPYVGETAICSAALRDGVYDDQDPDDEDRTFVVFTTNAVEMDGEVTDMSDASDSSRVVASASTGNEVQAYHIYPASGYVTYDDVYDVGAIGQKGGAGRYVRVTCSQDCLVDGTLTPIVAKTQNNNPQYIILDYVTIQTVTGAGPYIATFAADPGFIDGFTYGIYSPGEAHQDDVVILRGSSCTSGSLLGTCDTTEIEIPATIGTPPADNDLVGTADMYADVSSSVSKFDYLMADGYPTQLIKTIIDDDELKLEDDLDADDVGSMGMMVLSRDYPIRGDNTNGYAPGTPICLAAYHAADDLPGYDPSSDNTADRTLIVTFVETSATTDSSTGVSGIVSLDSTGGEIGFRLSIANLADETETRDARSLVQGNGEVRYLHLIPGTNRHATDVIFGINESELPSDTARVTVTPIADGMAFIVDDIEIMEYSGACEDYSDQCVAPFSDFEAGLTDVDGSETALLLSFQLPNDQYTLLNDGDPVTCVAQSDGTCSYSLSTLGMTNAQITSALQLFTVAPPIHFPPIDDSMGNTDNTFPVVFKGYSYEGTDQSTAVFDSVSITVTVDPIADAPKVTVEDITEDEEDIVDLPVSNALVDSDGSESLNELILYDFPAGTKVYYANGEEVEKETQPLECFSDSYYVNWVTSTSPDTATICARDLTHNDLAGPVGSVKYVRCPPGCTAEAGDVEGSVYYSGDSSICRAAIHAGVFGDDGGVVRVTKVDASSTSFPTPICNLFNDGECRTTNGITTEDYDESDDVVDRKFLVESINFREVLRVTAVTSETATATVLLRVDEVIAIEKNDIVLLTEDPDSDNVYDRIGLYKVTQIVTEKSFRVSAANGNDLHTKVVADNVRVSSGQTLCDVFKVPQANITDLDVQFFEHGVFPVRASVTSVEALNGNTAETVKTIEATIYPLLDPPEVTAGEASEQANYPTEKGTATSYEAFTNEELTIGDVIVRTYDSGEILSCLRIANIPTSATLRVGADGSNDGQLRPYGTVVAWEVLDTGDANDVITIRFDRDHYLAVGDEVGANGDGLGTWEFVSVFTVLNSTSIQVLRPDGDTTQFNDVIPSQDAFGNSYYPVSRIEYADDGETYTVTFDNSPNLPNNDRLAHCTVDPDDTVDVAICIDDWLEVDYDTDIFALQGLHFTISEQLAFGDVELHFMADAIEPSMCSGGDDDTITFFDEYCMATDDCQSATADVSMSITVLHENTAPTFTFDDPLDLEEDLGNVAQTFFEEDFFTNVGAGTTYEDQFQFDTLTVDITCTSGPADCDAVEFIEFSINEEGTANLTLTLVEHAHGNPSYDIDLSDDGLDIYGMMSNNGPLTTSQTLNVNIEALADDPILEATSSESFEDSLTELDLLIELVDTDQSEELDKFVITSAPPGTQVDDGFGGTEPIVTPWTHDIDTGTVFVASFNYADMRVTPPPQCDVSFELQLKLHSTELSNLDSASADATVSVPVSAVADAGTFDIVDTDMNEDEKFPLEVTPQYGDDTDQSEEIHSLAFSAVPEGVVLTSSIGSSNVNVSEGEGAGVLNAVVEGGSFAADARLFAISVSPVAECSADFTLTVSSTMREANNLDTEASADFDVPIAVEPVADGVEALADDMTIKEDTAYILAFTPEFVDTDASEEITRIEIDGYLAGGTFDSSSVAFDGNDNFPVWEITPAGAATSFTAVDVAGLSIQAPEHCDDDFTITITGTATEVENSDEAVGGAAEAAITVTPVADEAFIDDGDSNPNDSLDNVAIDEDERVLFPFTPSFRDTDGSETITTLTIQNLNGVTFNDPADYGGTDETAVENAGVELVIAHADLGGVTGLSFSSAVECDADFTLTMVLETTETNTAMETDEQTAEASIEFYVDVNAVADSSAVGVPFAPRITEDVLTLFTITPLLNVDTDESEFLRQVTFSNVANDVTFDLPATSGDINGVAPTITADKNANDLTVGSLSILGAPESDVDFTLTVALTTEESENGDTEDSMTSSIGVRMSAAADEPSLLGFHTPEIDANGFVVEDDDFLMIFTPSLGDDTDLSELLHKVVGAGALPGSDWSPVDGVSVADYTADGSVITLTAAGSSFDRPAQQELHVSVSAAHQCDADFTLTFYAYTTEINGGDKARSIGYTQAVEVAAEADNPIVTAVPAATVDEDTCIQLDISVDVVDTDGSEDLYVLIRTDDGSQMSDPVTFYNTSDCTTLHTQLMDGDNTIDILSVDIETFSETVYFTIPENCDFDVDILIRASTTEGVFSSDDVEEVAAYTVLAVADEPSIDLSASDLEGNEDECIDISGVVSGAVVDTDGSETLTFDFSINVASPVGFSQVGLYSDGTCVTPVATDGSVFTVTDSSSLFFKLDADDDARDTIFDVEAVSTDTGDQVKAGEGSQTASGEITVTVLAVADGAAAGFVDTYNILEDADLVFDLNFPLGDTDSSEVLDRVVLSSMPSGMAIQDAESGVSSASSATHFTFTMDDVNFRDVIAVATISLSPPEECDTDFVMTVTPYTKEEDDDPDQIAVEEMPGDVDTTVIITADADTPTLTADDVTGNEDEWTVLALTPVSPDTDGSETLQLTFALDLPSAIDYNGYTMESSDETSNAMFSDGLAEEWYMDWDGATNPMFMLQEEHQNSDVIGDIVLLATVTTEEASNNDLATSTTVPFSLTISPVNDAPTHIATDDSPDVDVAAVEDDDGWWDTNSATAVESLDSQPDRIVGYLYTRDVDTTREGDTFIYEFWNGTHGSDVDYEYGVFRIDGDVILTTDAVLNFEYFYENVVAIEPVPVTFLVKSTDKGGLSVTDLITIEIEDVNEEPDHITFDPIWPCGFLSDGVTPAPEDVCDGGFPENNNSSAVGTFTTVDEDQSDSHTYSFAAGTPSEVLDVLEIVGDTLMCTSDPDVQNFEIYGTSGNWFNFTVESEDQGGLVKELSLSLRMRNVNEKPVSTIALSDITLTNSFIPQLVFQFEDVDHDYYDQDQTDDEVNYEDFHARMFVSDETTNANIIDPPQTIGEFTGPGLILSTASSNYADMCSNGCVYSALYRSLGENEAQFLVGVDMDYTEVGELYLVMFFNDGGLPAEAPEPYNGGEAEAKEGLIPVKITATGGRSGFRAEIISMEEYEAAQQR
eukprot:Rmarinus@m.6210